MDNSHDTPLVSVVIPTIKYDSHTHQSIFSIFAQYYENWEIILILDGASIEEVPSEIVNHERIKIVHHPIRLGTPTSLNDGIEVAQGEYIARLDADDVAHPKRLCLQVKYLQSNPEVCCVGTGGVLIDDGGNLLGLMPWKNSSSDVRAGFLERNQLIHSSVMYRKSVFNLIGGYNPRMTRMQDYDLFLRLARMAPVAYSSEIMCAYRTHLGQHSRKTSPFKIYSWEIIRQRWALRKKLDTSLFSQIILDLKWYIAQVLRYYGLRKPGYSQINDAHFGNKNDMTWLNPGGTT